MNKLILAFPFAIWIIGASVVVGLGAVVGWVITQFNPQVDANQALLIGVIASAAASHWTMQVCIHAITSAAELRPPGEDADDEDEEVDED